MTTLQMGITMAMCTAATMLTRFLPFLIFSSKDQQPPEVVRYLGRVLPAAIFGMLIVYCLKSVTPFAGSRGIPEAIALLAAEPDAPDETAVVWTHTGLRAALTIDGADHSALLK